MSIYEPCGESIFSVDDAFEKLLYKSTKVTVDFVGQADFAHA